MMTGNALVTVENLKSFKMMNTVEERWRDVVGVNGQIGVAGFKRMAGENAVEKVDEAGPLEQEGS